MFGESNPDDKGKFATQHKKGIPFTNTCAIVSVLPAWQV